jgi:PhnB protein
MGEAEKAMNYYKSILGGEFTIFQRYKEVPGGDKMPPADQEKILHISLAINKGATIMASDSVKPMGEEIASGNNFHICIHAENKPEVERIFEGLSKNGKADMPPNKTFWGAYFAMCKDQFGVSWMISHDELN